ncbi:MAG TPA: PilZ domain-containing protein [Rhabdaerophilum sp.]|nr:PilZ domain-containing protein [Rhabdaerophilum sp.]
MPFALNKNVADAHSQRIFRLTPEKRQVPRVKISIGGRFMLEDRSEHGGTACEASIQGLAVESDAKCRIGERIVGYFYTIGRVEGKVVRLTSEGFVMDMATTPLKRDRLANQLTWLANRDILNLPEDRRHDRIVPRDPRVEVRNLADAGTITAGHIIDISRSGAAVSVKGSFKPGDEIVLGTTPAHVVRAFDGGIAIEFHAAVPDAMFGVEIRL